MRLGPVLYDFVRGIIRPSMITLLAIFILLGIASSYFIADSIRRQGASYLAYYIPIVFELNTTTGSLRIEGYAIHPNGGDLEGVFKYNLTCGPPPTTYKFVNIKGKFAINDTVGLSYFVNNSCYIALWIEVETPLGTYTDTIPGDIKGFNMTAYIGGSNAQGGPSIYYEVRNESHHATSWFRAFYTRVDGGELMLTINLLPLSDPTLWETPLELYIANESAPWPKDSPAESGWRFVTRVYPGVNIIKIPSEVDEYRNMLQLTLRPSGNATLVSASVSGARPHIVLSEDIQKSMTMIVASLVGQGVFTAFFPILVLYLVYVFVAKPRSQGALEFILARPITRLDLFLTRLSASMLVVASAVTLFFAVTLLALQLFIGISIYLKPILILYLGTLSSMLAFLSLCYLVASWISGGSYLGLTIFFYVFFRMIYSVVPVLVIWITHGGLSYVTVDELVRTQYMVNYFNPFGVETYAQYFVQKELFGSTPLYAQIGLPDLGDIVNPYAVIGAYVGWIILPLIAGWFIFRRANLIR